MRKYGLDICRIFACMMVVMAHTIMLFWEFDPSSTVWAVYNFLALFSRCCVPLFFMISGALLLNREELDLKKHLRRMGHFLLLFVLWSLICALIDRLFLKVWYADAGLEELVFGSYYHLWYLPAMLLCYACVPVLHSALYRHSLDKRYILVLACFVVLMLNLQLVAGKPLWLELLLEHFSLYNLGYLCVMFLGWYLYKHRTKGRKLALLAVAAAVGLVFFAWLNRCVSIAAGQPLTTFYSPLCIGVLLFSAFVFSLCLHVEKLPEKLCPLVEELSACTLGIYLVHPLFISALKSLHLDFTQFNTFLFFPACYISFVLLSLLTSFVLRRIPLVKKLVS